jgi:hypothetical protein
MLCYGFELVAIIILESTTSVPRVRAQSEAAVVNVRVRRADVIDGNLTTTEQLLLSCYCWTPTTTCFSIVPRSM